MSHGNGWIGVDLDGTLASYSVWLGAGHIGEPILPMVKLVQQLLDEGKDVRIFTARIHSTPSNPGSQRDAAVALLAIQDWCFKVFGEVLPVTNVKDYNMETLYDDRAVQVVKNTGNIVGLGQP
jgi:hypothetical protein